MNPPVSGVSFFVSVLILIIGGSWRFLSNVLGIKIQGVPLSQTLRFRLGVLIVGLFVVMGVFISISITKLAYSNQNNNFALVEEKFARCISLDKQPPSDKMVILRLDDVQAYGWTDISIRMMEDALAAKMPIVAGTIAKDVTTDERLVKFFHRNHCNVEVALHGYDHGIGEAINYERDGVAEFEKLNRNEARHRLSKSLNEFKALPIGPVKTFIPPQNLISEEAHKVLAEYGFTYLSSEGTGAFDYHATTWNFSTGEYVYAKQVISDCEAHFNKGNNFCVIMLHPQDYAFADASLNEALYRDFTWLLDDIKRNNLQVVTFQDIDLEQLPKATSSEPTKTR